MFLLSNPSSCHLLLTVEDIKGTANWIADIAKRDGITFIVRMVNCEHNVSIPNCLRNRDGCWRYIK